MKRNLFFRLVTFYSLTTILFQSFLPFFYAVPHIAVAQEVTPTATPTTEPTLTPTPEISVTPTVAPTSEPTVEPTPTAIPTAEPTVLPTPTEIPSLTPTPTTAVAPTPTRIPSIWTFEKVELNKEYVAPQNSEVKLTFTKLPNPSGNIKMEEITLTAEQIKQTGSLSDKAYDITSDMKDGEFTYNLSLPIPESSKGKEVSVKFAETVNELSQVTEVSEIAKESDRVVVARGLNHFTVFIITGTNPPSASNIIDDGDANFSTNIAWNNYAAGISGDVKYISNVSGNWARWTFTDDQIPVAGQNYNIFTHWVVWNDHVTNATYKLYDDTGTLVSVLGTVDQNRNAAGVVTPNGSLSGWYTFSGSSTLNNGYYIQLETDGSNTRNIVADAIKIETADAPSEVWVDKSWTAGAGTDLGSDKVKGYNSFETIQEAITAVAANGTVHVAAGTYIEIGQIIIDKNVSIIGVDKNTVIIKPNQDTGSVGESRGWIVVRDGKDFTLQSVTLDGAGKNIHTAIRNTGNTSLTDNIIMNFSYPGYMGFAVNSNYQATGDMSLTVKNNTFSGYGRVGVHVDQGSGMSTALIDGNTFIGKGTGDHLDYAIEVEGGASVTITNNDISNNRGTVSPWTSAGIMATTYYAPGTNVKITNNSIHDNSYGVTMGYSTGDTTSVLQFNSNTFGGNTFDLDNVTNQPIDARNNTWSVTDQNSLDQIEGKINHYCSGSEYVHGVCDATYDYGTGFGIVRYKDIGTVTNSGWNVRSKSVTPNEMPIDLDCSVIRYTNENSVAQNWTGVSGTGIKYQREVTYPSGSIGFFNAGSSLYTPFSTFGSGVGIEGQWKARVRAYVDQNNNNVVDSSEESSAWSSYCTVVFDKTAPTATVSYDITTLTNSNVVATLVPSESVTVTNNSGSASYTFTANGSFTFNFRDAAGNTGTATANVTNIDKTIPSVPTGIYFKDTVNNKNIACGGWTSTRHLDVYWNANSESDFDHYEYISFNADGSTGAIRTFTTNYFNSSWWTVPLEGTYGVQIRAVDKAGNKSEWYGGAQGVANSCKFKVDWTAPTLPTGLNYSSTGGTVLGCGTNTNQYNIVAKWAASSDINFSHYEYRSFNPTTGWVWNGGNIGNVLSRSGAFTVGQGTYGFALKAVDLAGNASNWTSSDLANSCKVTYDATAPVMTCPNISVSNDVGFNGAVVSFSGSAADAIDGSLPVTYSPTSGTFFPVGTTSVNCSATDSAGNQGSKSFTVTVNDTEYPTVPGTPTTTTPSSTNTPTWTWTGSTDNAPGLHYVFYWSQTSGGEDYNSGNIGTDLSFTHSTALTGGIWYGKVKAVDASGNTTESGVGSVAIDTIAPTVTSVDSDGATYNLASASPTIKITFSEDITNTPTVEVHSVFTGETVTNCGDSDAKTFCFTYSLNPEEVTHTIYISGAQDAAGNTMTLDTTHTFIVDRIAPIFDTKTEFSGWYNTDQTSTFSYTGATTGNNPTCDIATEGTAQTCSVTPNVCDAASNCNTTPITSNGADIDKTKPDSIITSPSSVSSGSTVYLNDWSGEILGTATDSAGGSGLDKVLLSIKRSSDGKYYTTEDGWIDGTEETTRVLTTGTATWSFTLPTPVEDDYTITSHAVDLATNTENSYTLTIIFDKTIPEVAISLNPTVGDAANGWYKTQPEVTLTATDTHFDKIEFQWDSQTGAWTTYTAPFKPGNEGAHVLYYRAHDKANNYSDVGVKNIKWNKTDLKDGPLNVSVSPNPTSESTSKVKWDAATSETIGIDKYEIQWKLKNGDKNYSASVGNGVREYTVDNLIEGVWEVKVTAFDASGNSKSASVDLTVDRSGPSAPTLSVFGTAPGSVSLSWSKVTDAVNYIIWYGTTPGSYQYGAKVGDTQSYTVQGLGGGTYYFIVKAVDASGNQGANSNEVSSGAIGGAAGVAPGTPAQGFAEEVLGANTLTPTPTPAPTGAVLGTETNGTKPWWWPWILLLLLPPAFWFGYKKWKERNG
ncbi:MAG: HYR domain-containing protein [Microgenomates group bacterium]